MSSSASLLLPNLSRAISTEFLSAIEVPSVDAGPCGRTSSELALCNVLVVRLAVFLTELLKPPGRTIRYVFNTNKTTYNQMLEQSIDLLTTPFSLHNLEEDAAYFHSLPSYSVEYGFFGNTNVGTSRRSVPTSLQFLFAPFTPAVWLLIGLSIVFVSGVENAIVGKYMASNGSGMRTSLLALSSVAMIGVFYNTELKTLAVLPGDLFDLAESIRHGERVVIVERNRTVRSDLLTNSTMYRSESLQAVYEAIRDGGVEKTLLYEPDIRKICHLLETSPRHVFFGYEEKLVGICRLNGLIKYFSIDYPVYTLVGVATTSPAAKYASTLLHAFPNYRSIALTRLIGRIRTPETKTENAPLIGAECVGAGGVVLGVGLTAALIVLGIEVLWKRRKDERRYHVRAVVRK